MSPLRQNITGLQNLSCSKKLLFIPNYMKNKQTIKKKTTTTATLTLMKDENDVNLTRAISIATPCYFCFIPLVFICMWVFLLWHWSNIHCRCWKMRIEIENRDTLRFLAYYYFFLLYRYCDDYHNYHFFILDMIITFVLIFIIL